MKLASNVVVGALLTVALSNFAAAPVRADDPLAACAKVDNDLDRLACYDRLSGRTPAVTVAATSPGEWYVQTEKSTITDDTDVTLSVESAEDASCRFLSSGKATLFVRCHENATALVIHTGCHMTSSEYDDYGDVDIRLDSERARTVSMTESTTNEALGLWNGGSAIPLIKQIFGKQKLLARVRPYAANQITFSFNVTGLQEAIAPLRKACGW